MAMPTTSSIQSARPPVIFSKMNAVPIIVPWLRSENLAALSLSSLSLLDFAFTRQTY